MNDSNLILPQHLQNSLKSEQFDQLKTGTTTLAMIVKEGVVMATESQATAGFYIASKKAQKLFKVNEHCALTIAGGVADCQYVVGQAQAISRLLSIENDKEPTVDYLAHIVRNILFNGRSYYYSFNIVGGYSTKYNCGKIYPIDFIGFMSDSEDFVSLGSGSTYTLGVLEGNWKPNLSIDEGIELARKAITASRNRDAGSGYGLQICAITKDGFKAIEGPLLND